MPAAPVHHTATVDTPWDGSAAEKNFDGKPGDFPKFYAWVDKGAADADADGTDKEDGWGPHHEVNADGVPGAANVNGVHAAVAALNGAHGAKSRIPDGDRQGVFNHLVAHLKDAGVKDEDLPTLRSAHRRRRKYLSRALGPGREFRISGPPTGGEFRATVNGDSITFEGLAIRYNATYTVRDMFGEFDETMKPGAARAVVENGADVRFLLNHDGLPLARTTSGTLELDDSDEGLHVRASVDRRQSLANDLAIALERRDVTQMSVGMIVGNDVWNDDYTKRAIYGLDDLFDVSAVTYAASPTTSLQLAARSMFGMPVASRARLRSAFIIARNLRDGKAITADQATALQAALEALHRADDVDINAIIGGLQDIDAGQGAISDVLGVDNPDGDAADVYFGQRNDALIAEMEMLALRGRRHRI